MRKQMNEGAHLITVQAANQNSDELEAAYSKQTDFALDMLHQTRSINKDQVDFTVEHFKDGFVLAHGYRFNERTPITTISGKKTFEKGETLWFNNSDNPTVQELLDRNNQAGFKSVLTGNQHGRMVWQHLRAE